MIEFLRTLRRSEQPPTTTAGWRAKLLAEATSDNERAEIQTVFTRHEAERLAA